MKTLVVIPAKGNSKRLPKKNICEVGGKPMYYQTEETRLKRELARQEHKDNLMNTEVFSFLGQKIEDRCSKEENVHKEVCIKVRNNDGVYKLE